MPYGWRVKEDLSVAELLILLRQAHVQLLKTMVRSKLLSRRTQVPDESGDRGSKGDHAAGKDALHSAVCFGVWVLVGPVDGDEEEILRPDDNCWLVQSR